MTEYTQANAIIEDGRFRFVRERFLVVEADSP